MAGNPPRHAHGTDLWKTQRQVLAAPAGAGGKDGGRRGAFLAEIGAPMARDLLVYCDMFSKAPRSRRPRPLLSFLGGHALLGAQVAALASSLTFALSSFAAPATIAAAPEQAAALEALVKSAAAAHLPAPTATQRLEVSPIRGPAPPADCAGKLQADVAAGIQAPGRVLIELRCSGQSHWQLFVPVRIVGTTPAVIARHAIVAGAILGPADLVTEQRDVLALPPGYLNDPAIAIGMTASRALAGGTILTNQQLAGSRTVQRGQSVTLLAIASGISVRMPGKALSDGFVNQRVRVENLSSGKIVEGIARSDQVVEIVLQ